MIRYLTWHDLQRNLRPARAAALLALSMIACYNEISQPFGAERSQIQGSFTFHSEWLWGVSLLASAWLGSALADERALGLTVSFFAKGVSRRQYLWSKMLGAAASGALLTSAAIVGFYLQVIFLWPGGRIVCNITDGSPGPVPALYAVSPLRHDLLLVAMRITSGAAWPLLGVLAGTFTANRYVAMAFPVVVGLAFLLVTDFNSGAQVVNPSIYFTLDSFYTERIPPSLRPYAPFVYWACFALLVGGLSRWFFTKRELR